jgi:hypothetical protein
MTDETAEIAQDSPWADDTWQERFLRHAHELCAEVSYARIMKAEYNRALTSSDFYRGVRAAITWLHVEAQRMSDPHARSVLNNAAFHLGVNKPVALVGSSEENKALRSHIKELEAALSTELERSERARGLLIGTMMAISAFLPHHRTLPGLRTGDELALVVEHSWS